MTDPGPKAYSRSDRWYCS